MALLRCPVCNRKGEVPGHDPRGRYRCAHCAHSFLAGEAASTHEHNILADDSPPFVHESVAEPTDLPLSPRWGRWVARLAEHCRLEPGEVLYRALTQFARENGFGERPPTA